ncbi:MAG: PEP-CTERM sorting domain-containing protein [Candidatus Erginobacter occultus]|nr:PEP-CTERM sorting domain-containing protein [Candidatus Erginobacter occultus]
MTEFYGPPTGSTDPYNFTWRIFDGMTIWSATIDSTNWSVWQGDGTSFWLNLDRDQPLHVAPEPATLVILGLIGGTGLIAGWKKRKCFG